jgi:hypothetical protein
MPKPSARPRRPQTWKTFVRNHLVGTIAIDFPTVPTVTFGVVYVLGGAAIVEALGPDGLLPADGGSYVRGGVLLVLAARARVFRRRRA